MQLFIIVDDHHNLFVFPHQLINNGASHDSAPANDGMPGHLRNHFSFLLLSKRALDVRADKKTGNAGGPTGHTDHGYTDQYRGKNSSCLRKFLGLSVTDGRKRDDRHEQSVQQRPAFNQHVTAGAQDQQGGDHGGEDTFKTQGIHCSYWSAQISRTAAN